MKDQALSACSGGPTPGKTEGLLERQLQRTALADKTSENQSRVQNHSATEIQAEDKDEELRQLTNAKRQGINFPAATAEKQW
ncbi:reverse transcriptase [Elysia marginata]|uniref:Reverse transcriptase n=1 Tax=Elysia marginata TaxID=1093978 RepID=A0AAV4EFI8_9GAST|nr:reverse transcriptase [Elysia marginata]